MGIRDWIAAWQTKWLCLHCHERTCGSPFRPVKRVLPYRKEARPGEMRGIAGLSPDNAQRSMILLEKEETVFGRGGGYKRSEGKGALTSART